MMATKQSLTLPNEIWIRVLENLTKEQDIPDAWLSCRHVSTAFKAAVESIFRERHLPKTWIVFYLGTIYNEDDERVVLDCAFDFDRLSEDKNVAIFKMKPPKIRYNRLLRTYLGAAVEGTPVDEPVHTVKIRRQLNDTPIPGLSIDYDKWELSCNWRELYTIFFGEEQLYTKYRAKWAKDREAWTLDIQKQMARGEIDMVTAIEKALHALASGSDEAKKMARRARIRRQWMRDEGYEYDFEQIADLEEEKAILKRLREGEHFLSLEKYSDDEDTRGGSDNENDPDQDEEDEWEDEPDEEGSEEAGMAEDDENNPAQSQGTFVL